jgi:hypothetical protein
MILFNIRKGRNEMQKDINTDDMSDAERQDLNRRMYDWFNGVTRCNEEDCDCGGEWNRWEV